MIETLAARADIGRPGNLDCRGWDRRSNRATAAYVAPREALPAGLSEVRVTQTPTGWKARVEGNLTALLHGPDAVAGSLTADEVPRAIARLIGQAVNVAPVLPESLWRWDVRRFDPSGSFRVGNVGHAVLSAHASWMAARKGQQRVTLHSSTGDTVVWSHNKGRSWEVYDKSARSRLEHRPCPAGVARVEARLFPKSNTYSLDETERLVMAADEELRRLVESVEAAIPTAAEVMLATILRGYDALGVQRDASEASRLLGLAMLGGTKPLVAQGVPRNTAWRWEKRLRELLDAAGGGDAVDRAVTELFDPQSVLFARDLLDQVDNDD